MTARRYRMLGGLEVIGDSGRLDLGSRKQRALLAVLLLADGATVSVDRIVDQVWGERPPDRVDASLQAYVSTLRKVLEPDRAPRSPAAVLVTRGAGYALLAAPEEVDARRFADLVQQGRDERAAGDLPRAATTLRNALAMYAPLLPEFESEAFHAAAAEHLERLHLSAQELSFQVRLDLGEHALVLTDLESAVARSPLHEELWALLALARYRVGRQSDALRAIADCKRLLAEEVGIDPGPRLRALEADILCQSEDLAPRPEQRPAPAREVVVGRTEELSTVRTAVAEAIEGRDALVLVEGEPGSGKTRLVEEAAQRAQDTGGVLVLWGRCAEGDGAPAMWPWVQVLTQVLHVLPDDDREQLLDTELGRLVTSGRTVVGVPSLLPDAGARFRLFDQAGQLLDAVAGRRPLMIVLDDLQWADQPSLALFVHLAQRRPGRAVLLAAMRDRSAGDALPAALAELSRLPGHRRVRLGPLTGDDVAELIHRETGHRPSADLLGRSGSGPGATRSSCASCPG